MLPANKTAIIHGAGGAIGGAVAYAFAREGANVFLAGRTLAKVDAVAKEIASAGGQAETAQVDALDEQHTGAVADKTGRIDISFNAIGLPQQGVQGIPLVELSADSFTLPVMAYTKAHFLTATAAARRMVGEGSGVILTLTLAPARMAIPLMGGMAPAWGRSKRSPGVSRRSWGRGASGWSVCGRTPCRRRQRSARSSVFTARASARPPSSSRRSWRARRRCDGSRR
jgi:NAD(P)-dependent dehydrogenase (short-subunit alcohol dehydrogenase family)